MTACFSERSDDQVLLSPVAKPGEGRLVSRGSWPRIRAVPVDTRKGEQHAPSYLAINPNAKTPSIVDGEATIFDSSAILLYLAEKTGRFLPENTPKARGELLSWLFFVSSGIGPYSGQSFHFNVAAPEKIEYAINRYNFETHRHWKILDERLAGRKYVLGDVYTIVDMAVWGWSSAAPYLLGAETWSKMTNVKRLVDELNERPAVARVNKLKDKHAFKQEFDEEARRSPVSASDKKSRLTQRLRRHG